MAEQEPNWKELALAASEKLREAQTFIQKVTSPPFVYGTVIGVNNDSVDVTVDGKSMEISFLDSLRDQLQPGTSVRLNPETFAVIGVRESKFYISRKSLIGPCKSISRRQKKNYR